MVFRHSGRPKITRNRLLGLISACLGPVLACRGLSWTCLGSVLVRLGSVWACLGLVLALSGTHLGLSKLVLSLSWPLLDLSWACLCSSWACLGPPGACLDVFLHVMLEMCAKSLLAFVIGTKMAAPSMGFFKFCLISCTLRMSRTRQHWRKLAQRLCSKLVLAHTRLDFGDA